MNTLIPKIVAGAFVLAGVGAILYETGNSNSEDLLSQDTSFVSQPKKRFPKKGDCNIFQAEFEREMDQVSNTAKGKFTKFKDEFWTEEEFIKELDSGNLMDKENLKHNIKNACQKSGKKAFVRWDLGRTGDTWKHTWVYDEHMNNENWLEKEGVDVPENLKPENWTD
ncbi:hypothetical protein MHC_04840 [Mycoplasma haemocanis str. Illinois]|uniref:Uncharacterized protein n=1 Tax=Mycoplasma haemocanis (strain Illinois) TaxID=1111676 RepID=H6N852_MYCHN|nr:hypothetical protein [Mycoplasma haemocanis]AEW45824.1 hypothetical protein MHC_04840 [Mycoplasma haemocanis str. Illinois]